MLQISCNILFSVVIQEIHLVLKMSYPISKNTSLVGKIKHLLTSTVSLGVEAKPVLRLVDRDDFQLNGKDMELYLGTPEQPLFSWSEVRGTIDITKRRLKI
ncbi:uncharacterized protein LOC143257221 isoform X1 [Tachypleus tridentatus]|uniref:uncharacterized protein LOC143257221 isoform X1 n=1 Tax=Tachypleus tridentatus TaxID=6853 RepID=UPI003FD5ABAC